MFKNRETLKSSQN